MNVNSLKEIREESMIPRKDYRTIKEFPNYAINCYGTIVNYWTGAKIKHDYSGTINVKSPRVELWKDGKRFKRSVNKLILEYFKDEYYRLTNDEEDYNREVYARCDPGNVFINEDDAGYYYNIHPRLVAWSARTCEPIPTDRGDLYFRYY